MTPPSSGEASSSSSRANSPFKPWLLSSSKPAVVRRQGMEDHHAQGSSLFSSQSKLSAALYSAPAQPDAADHHAQAFLSRPRPFRSSSFLHRDPLSPRSDTDGMVASQEHAIQGGALGAARTAALGLDFAKGRICSDKSTEIKAVSAATMGENVEGVDLPFESSRHPDLPASSRPEDSVRQGNSNIRPSPATSSRNSQSPTQSGSSTPSSRLLMLSQRRPQVLETNHLHLNTHAPSGRRMINQYIIDEELGRGVHGKVRLARDTETGERVAVKIVEREGRKRLGGGMKASMLNRPISREAVSADRSGAIHEGKEKQSRDKIGSSEQEATSEAGQEHPFLVDNFAALREGEDERHDRGSDVGSENGRDLGSGHARFVTPPRSPTVSSMRPTGPHSPQAYASARYGRWGEGAPLRPTYGDKEREKEREKARKRLLWTTDKKVKREIAIMKKCAHEHVVGLKEVIDDPQSKKIFMVLEYMEGGEVQWKDDRNFPTLTVEEARQTIRDVVLGLEYLHYQGIIHRDIKPANLLWDDQRRVKISDFGVSHFSYALLVASGGSPNQESNGSDPSLLDDHELAKTAGSPAFFAPELCLVGDPSYTLTPAISGSGSGTPRLDVKGGFPWQDSDTGDRDSLRPSSSATRRRPPITKAIDVWAMGVTLYCLLFGHPPFTADSEFALFAIIPREDFTLPATMGADRIRIGPRKKRWRTLPQWSDEEADVQPEIGKDENANIDEAQLTEEALQVRDLLDRLLAKNPSERIKLDEVKKHPWIVRGIADPPTWINETDPQHLPSVEVSHEEVEDALTGFSKFKQRMKQLQMRLLGSLSTNVSSGSTRRQRSKSASQAHGRPQDVVELSSSAAAISARYEAGRNAATSTTSTLASSTRGSQQHRPNLFFRRQFTADGNLGESRQPRSSRSRLFHHDTDSRKLLFAKSPQQHEKEQRRSSQSQPSSRAHTPPNMNTTLVNYDEKLSHNPERLSQSAVSLLRDISKTNPRASRAQRPTLLRDKGAVGPKSAHDVPTMGRCMAPLGLKRSSSDSHRDKPEADLHRASHKDEDEQHGQSTIAALRRSPRRFRHHSSLLFSSRDQEQASSLRSSESSRWTLVPVSAHDQNPLSSYQQQEETGRRTRSRLGQVFRSVLGGPSSVSGSSEGKIPIGLNDSTNRLGTETTSRPVTAPPIARHGASERSFTTQAKIESAFDDRVRMSEMSVGGQVMHQPLSMHGEDLTIDSNGAAKHVGPWPDPKAPASAPLPSSLSRGTMACAADSNSSRPLSSLSSTRLSQANDDGDKTNDEERKDGGIKPSRQKDNEIDDCDLDIDEFSDDESLDSSAREVQAYSRAGSASGQYLHNAGSGWMWKGSAQIATGQDIHEQEQPFEMPADSDENPSSVPEGQADNSADVSASESLVPSVEGGYNLFKSPDPASHLHVDAHDFRKHAIVATGSEHEGEVAALRRGSAASRHPDPAEEELHRANKSASNYLWFASPKGQEEVGDATEDRFADADEESDGDGPYVIREDLRAEGREETLLAERGADEEQGEEDDEEDWGGGVSFSTGKHSYSMRR